MYFALDPKTGIDSHPEQDPWKWAQEVSEKMAVSEDSCLVFIAGQPEAMGVPLYRDLPNNQVPKWGHYIQLSFSSNLFQTTQSIEPSYAHLMCGTN